MQSCVPAQGQVGGPFDKKIKFCFIGRAERRKGIEELNKALLSLYSELNFLPTFSGGGKIISSSSSVWIVFFPFIMLFESHFTVEKFT